MGSNPSRSKEDKDNIAERESLTDEADGRGRLEVTADVRRAMCLPNTTYRTE